MPSSSGSDDEIVEGKISGISESSVSFDANLPRVDGVSIGLSELRIDDNSKSTATEASTNTRLRGDINGSVSSWRLDCAKQEVWYGSYGSNMWKPRFLCYIKGGQV